MASTTMSKNMSNLTRKEKIAFLEKKAMQIALKKAQKKALERAQRKERERVLKRRMKEMMKKKIEKLKAKKLKRKKETLAEFLVRMDEENTRRFQNLWKSRKTHRTARLSLSMTDYARLVC